MDEALQECPRGQECGPAGDCFTEGGDHARDPSTVHGQGAGRFLAHEEVRTGEDVLLHDLQVLRPVDLGPAGAHGRALAGVQDAELDPGLIRPFAHHSAQRVDFFDHLTFGQSADGRIAGQVSDAVHIDGQKQGLHAHVRRGHGGFASGVPGTDDDDVENLRHGGGGHCPSSGLSKSRWAKTRASAMALAMDECSLGWWAVLRMVDQHAAGMPRRRNDEATVPPPMPMIRGASFRSLFRAVFSRVTTGLSGGVPGAACSRITGAKEMDTPRRVSTSSQMARIASSIWSRE